MKLLDYLGWLHFRNLRRVSQIVFEALVLGSWRFLTGLPG